MSNGRICVSNGRFYVINGRIYVSNGRFLVNWQMYQRALLYQRAFFCHQRAYLCYQRAVLCQLATGNGQRATGVLVKHKPEMQRTGLPAMPTQQHINYDNSKRHPRISGKELELQVTERDLPMAVPTVCCK